MYAIRSYYGRRNPGPVVRHSRASAITVSACSVITSYRIHYTKLYDFSGCATWKGVKKDSSDAWDATKDGASKAYDSTKNAIHKATE